MRIFFLSSSKPSAQQALLHLIERYGQSTFHEADYVVAVGGDGAALHALHSLPGQVSKPVFSMRHGGSVGFLGNAFSLECLSERLARSSVVHISPLSAKITNTAGESDIALGINEITLMRQSRQSSRMRLLVNGVERASYFVGDGVLLATPIGSTAYNRSAGGPILPLESKLLTLTGLSVFYPFQWSNLVLADSAVVDLEVLEPTYRPVKLETDVSEYLDVQCVTIRKCTERHLTLLFDHEA